MQVVIPMSGFGERFRRAGYAVPKPLIEVDGKPVIEHVVELFPGAEDIVFVCNRDHLAAPAFAMAETLRRILHHILMGGVETSIAWTTSASCPLYVDWLDPRRD